MDLNDDSLYYNTQGSAKEYWAAHGPLPAPTKDLRQLRHDFHEFGYCLIEEAFSKEQLNTIRTRVVEQAAGERLAGVAFHYAGRAGTGKTTHATQFVTSLANKGDCFRGFMEHDPAVVQAGPLIEQLLNQRAGLTSSLPHLSPSSLLKAGTRNRCTKTAPICKSKPRCFAITWCFWTT